MCSGTSIIVIWIPAHLFTVQKTRHCAHLRYGNSSFLIPTTNVQNTLLTSAFPTTTGVPSNQDSIGRLNLLDKSEIISIRRYNSPALVYSLKKLSVNCDLPFNFPHPIFNKGVPIRIFAPRLRRQLRWLSGQRSSLGLYFHQNCIV